MDNKKIEILKKRAEKLSIKIEEDDERSLQSLFFSFYIEKELYAIESKFVDEVAVYKSCLRLPLFPNHILGLVNHRGKITTITDLGEIFGLTSLSNDSDQYILFLKDSNEFEVGILASKLHEVIFIDQSKLVRPSFDLTSFQKKTLLGVSSNNIICLDGRKILDDDTYMRDQKIA